MKKLLKRYILFGCLMLLISFPSQSTADISPTENGPHFKLVILNQDWYDLKLGYTYAQALPILKSTREAERLCVIGEEEIESYYWSRQSMTLTRPATDKLIRTLPRDQDLKKPVLAMAMIKKKQGWGNPIEAALHLKGFLVTVDDEPIFAGIFLEPMSQLAVGYPVIRPGMVDGKAVFHWLPVQIPFMAYDPVSKERAVWDAAVAPEGARDWALFPPAMKSHFINIGNRPETIEFRNLIKNPKVREIMERAGKIGL